MADGTTKAISEIEPGDWVYAADPENEVQGPREVTHTWPHTDTLYEFETSAGTITTTSGIKPMVNGNKPNT